MVSHKLDLPIVPLVNPHSEKSWPVSSFVSILFQYSEPAHREKRHLAILVVRSFSLNHLLTAPDRRSRATSPDELRTPSSKPVLDDEMPFDRRIGQRQ